MMEQFSEATLEAVRRLNQPEPDYEGCAMSPDDYIKAGGAIAANGVGWPALWIPVEHANVVTIVP